MKLGELYPEDRDRKINGVKRQIHDDGTYVVVAAWLNPLHVRGLNRWRVDKRSGETDAEAEDRNNCRVMAETILRGWGGPGTEPYTVESAEQMLYRHLSFRNEVMKLSQEEADLLRREESESGKASPRGSKAPRRGRRKAKPNGAGSGVSVSAAAPSLTA